MLMEFLSIGMITFQDYKNAQYESSWQKDMSLAEQMGLVKKQNPGCYSILRDIRLSALHICGIRACSGTCICARRSRALLRIQAPESRERSCHGHL